MKKWKRSLGTSKREQGCPTPKRPKRKSFAGVIPGQMFNDYSWFFNLKHHIRHKCVFTKHKPTAKD